MKRHGHGYRRIVLLCLGLACASGARADVIPTVEGDHDNNGVADNFICNWNVSEFPDDRPDQCTMTSSSGGTCNALAQDETWGVPPGTCEDSFKQAVHDMEAIAKITCSSIGSSLKSLTVPDDAQQNEGVCKFDLVANVYIPVPLPATVSCVASLVGIFKCHKADNAFTQTIDTETPVTRNHTDQPEMIACGVAMDTDADGVPDVKGNTDGANGDTWSKGNFHPGDMCLNNCPEDYDCHPSECYCLPEGSPLLPPDIGTGGGDLGTGLTTAHD